jgi:DNA-binding XRE family transcriptional regulator
MSRPEIRCARCRLYQFMTANGDCRRCHASLLPPVSGACGDAAAEVKEEVPMRFSAMIPERMRALRNYRHLSQGRLGKKIGAHRTWVSGVERGFRIPTIDSLERICIALEVPFHVVFFPPEAFASFVSRKA